ncbi:50S ribosomal protein L22 [Candidatus Phytoplasma oryzae]|uniref:Large ribosomal subunit protein uL22 n=1 Tax=Candidatus Phytoplasma oryzae TaxID=203274 RepID=A0A328IIF5_9MOLU|nr:50S ribosomal protein L22 [Candidatus Phytoplasma oryzae]RAM57781.1 50S ribosomal protein L22 [Candidatus Phytoplasma oryzae]
MNVKASANQIPITPRKARLVVDLIRGKKIKEAQSILMFTSKAASPIILKLLKSVVANAINNHNLNEDDLYVDQIFVNEGIRLTRFSPRAKGKTNKIKKRTSHITIIVSYQKNKNELKEMHKNGSKK